MLTFLPIFGVVSILNFGHYNKYVMHLIVVTGIFLMTYVVEHHFTCLFAIIYLLWGVSVNVFSLLPIRLFIF